MINDFSDIEIPKGCLIAKQDPSFAINSESQFDLRPEILNQASEYVADVTPEWISDIISVMVAYDINELSDPDFIESNFGSLNEFKGAIVSELSEILPCFMCPLANKVCLPEMRFDETSDKIRVIPRPLDYVSPEGFQDFFTPLDTEPKQPTSYNDLPLAY